MWPFCIWLFFFFNFLKVSLECHSCTCDYGDVLWHVIDMNNVFMVSEKRFHLSLRCRCLLKFFLAADPLHFFSIDSYFIVINIYGVSMSHFLSQFTTDVYTK